MVQQVTLFGYAKSATRCAATVSRPATADWRARRAGTSPVSIGSSSHLERVMATHAVTIALSAFLLFLVQPILAKQILPWFGGAAAVWTTCMMFFQIVLLAGYAYSDFVIRRLEPARQRLVHAALLVASLACLPIVVSESLRPADADHPVGRILWLLALTIGLPYFALSTTGPLLQAWFARQFPQARVYRLYALSNVASMSALVAYPPLIEPSASTRVQSLGWSAGYAVFVAMGLALLWRGRSTTAPIVTASIVTAPIAAAPIAAAPIGAVRATGPVAPGAGEQLWWLLLSGLGSVLLLAVTAHLTQNVAAVPFLWLLPLALYLLSFILCFDGRGWYRPRGYLLAAVLSCVLMMGGLFGRVGPGWRVSLGPMPIEHGVALYALGLFVLCMFLHGELAARRPAAAQLTRFYLMVSLGGAAGGVFVAVVAPLLFDGYFELPLALVAVGVVLLFAGASEGTRFAAFVGLAATGSCALLALVAANQGTLATQRDFHGVLRVTQIDADRPERARLRLSHGNTLHGEQLAADGARNRPTAYFGPTSGVGRALAALRTLDGARPQRVGVVGLGIGTLAAYGRSGDSYRFYEIDPLVERLARAHFSFLADSAALVQVELGDGRLLLEREAPQALRLLAIDAFSSDSIPVHLLTVEAMRAYARHVDADGAVAFHVSNRYLGLAPVVRHLADRAGWRAIRVIDTPPPDIWWLTPSDWVIVTPNTALADALLASGGVEAQADPRVAPWTDGYSNLFDVLTSWR